LIRQLRSTPNLITLLRLIFIPFIIITVIDNNYRWALVLFVLAGVSDGLDGTLARALKQKTVLGQYLDPIADKLLLSSLFLVLSLLHKIPWRITILVFSRDICIIATCAVLYATTSLRTFQPSVFGKVNTLAQIVALFFVLLRQISDAQWVVTGRWIGLWATFAFTLISGIHYIILTAQRLRAHEKSAGETASRRETA
jgi:cardiolipin synthase (CMP-forming)